MKLIIDNKEIELVNCNTFFTRLKGFMFTKNINKALMFKNCNSIHTCFMKENIGVIMCDKNNNVLYYYNNLGKWKFILPKKNVYIVYETPSNYFNIKINAKVKIDNNN